MNYQVNEETGNRRPVMLTLLRVPRLNKNSKNSNGQELEKTLAERKELDIKRQENKGNGMDIVLNLSRHVLQGTSVPLQLKFWPISLSFLIRLLGDLKDIQSSFLYVFSSGLRIGIWYVSLHRAQVLDWLLRKEGEVWVEMSS